MQVGDLVKITKYLVKHNGFNSVVWFGIISKEKSVLKTEPQWPYKQYTVKKYLVEWTFGDQGWFFPQRLEVISSCK